MNVQLVNLRQKMIEREFTQKDLCEAIGRSESNFSLKMNGRISWTWQDICRICRALDIPTEEAGKFFPAFL